MTLFLHNPITVVRQNIFVTKSLYACFLIVEKNTLIRSRFSHFRGYLMAGVYISAQGFVRKETNFNSSYQTKSTPQPADYHRFITQKIMIQHSPVFFLVFIIVQHSIKMSCYRKFPNFICYTIQQTIDFMQTNLEFI
jgi:hypothetical protein